MAPRGLEGGFEAALLEGGPDGGRPAGPESV
ncbi:hypothetical protein HNQ70_003571 [Quisquiliibacterium transsilvanicum]|uniref:Uncharacterized protein n=1 Tax=Quisquiliibacterium transsilvanicum TaxID=1549638 RepID=A0A7W8HK49_9BURK|nr:hypothetical protein [Quisquiliibacterium transsilvanicum]